MDRSKFKEALGQLDTPQRKALLYLEKQINETRIMKAKTHKSTDEQILSDIKNRLTSLEKTANNLNIKIEREKTQNAVVLNDAKNLSTIIKEIQKMFMFQHEQAESMAHNLNLINKKLNFHPQIFKNKKEAIKRFNGMKNIVESKEMIDNILKELEE